MPKWIETKTYCVKWDISWKHENMTFKDGMFNKVNELYMYSPPNRIINVLNEVQEYIEIGQYEIKSIVPLSDGHAAYCQDNSSHTNSSWGLGWGWGVSPTEGAIIFLQRDWEVTKEEFDKLLESKTLKKQLDQLKDQLPELEKIIENGKNNPDSIEEKKGMFGGTAFMVGSKKFKTREEAEAALNELTDNTNSQLNDYNNIKSQIQDIENQIKEARSCLPWRDIEQ